MSGLTDDSATFPARQAELRACPFRIGRTRRGSVRLGSACSGVGCIDLGLERAGFESAWQIEIDPTCRAVLERHWPDVERMEDLRDAAQLDLPRVDLIAGGTPCQDLSVAGKGAGLDGERSALFYDFIRLADSQPWATVLWENVPGALSSNGGRDFAVCLEGFTGTRFEVPPDGWRNSGVAFGSYRWAVWRVLDAQNFGVAQRRRRVFVVASPRGRCGPEVLFGPESLPGDSPPREGEGSRAATLTAGRPGSGRRQEDDLNVVSPLTTGCGSRGGDHEQLGGHLVVSALQAAGSRASGGDAGGGSEHIFAHLRGEGFDASEDGTGRGTPLVVDEQQITSGENRSNPKPGDPAPTMANPARTITYAVDTYNQTAKPGGASHALRCGSGDKVPAVYQCHGSNVGPMGAIRSGNGKEAGGVPFVASPLTASSGKTVETAGSGGSGPKNLVFQERGQEGGRNLEWTEGPAYALTSPKNGSRSQERNVLDGLRPRRLTPTECERLMDLPDSWTELRADGSVIADGPRYRMIGNGAAVPVLEWIGRRIMKAGP